jgi:hypothetical protein
MVIFEISVRFKFSLYSITCKNSKFSKHKLQILFVFRKFNKKNQECLTKFKVLSIGRKNI